MLNPKKWSIEWGGRELTVEVGRLALQATASCTVRYGDTVILATAVMSESTRDIDYFPLMVNFEEKLYAAGKIKGSRFIKREGRPSDESILSGRVIDRALRPLFDDRIRNEIQVVITALAVDQENDAAIVGLVAASIVLGISNIPWNGPIAGARIGSMNGELVLNATATQVEEGDLDLVVAGTPDKLVMVEAGANEVSEDDMYKAIRFGSDSLAPVLKLIEDIKSEIGVQKKTVEEVLEAAGIDETANEIKDATEAFVSSVADAMIFDAPKHTRKERYAMMDAVKDAAKEHLLEKGYEEEVLDAGLKHTKAFVCNEISKRILEKDQRLDGRSITEVRELQADVDLLPRVHGTAMFMRGDTQVLSVVTLGAPGDVQTLDTMEEDGTKRYMHHYNDAPYTYGDVGFMRGPSRRAIGHGALAERALEPVLPEQEAFPYTIRVVSEVMGSNGSSSMASTCGSSLSLMAAGVPIKKPVAGIAMGLSSRNGEDGEINTWKVLTDLQDVEDGKGGMDLKIAGTEDGITAVQMDTKTNGLPWDLVEKAIHQARDARLQILGVMNERLSEVQEMSPYAPRIETIHIDPEKIREVIGPGGKVINAIIDETGVQIDIEQDGRVMVTSNDSEGMAKAIEMIQNIVREPEAGEEFEGKVVRLEDFGAFVNILPGKDGLVHVSEIAWERVEKPGDVLKMGDTVKVKVKEIDNLGRINLSMKVLKPKPEGYQDRPPRNDRGGGSRGGHRGGSRGPRRDDRKDGPPKKRGFFKRDK